MIQRTNSSYLKACLAAALLAAIALGSGERAAGQEQPSPAPLQTSVKPAQVIARLEERLPRLMKEADVPGLGIALIRDGELVWHHGFGVKNSKTKEKVDDTTIFEAASLSKPVFASAIKNFKRSLELNPKNSKAVEHLQKLEPDDTKPDGAKADRPLDDAARSAVIDELINKLNRIYVFPEMAKKMEQAIRARQAKKEYDAITSGQEFAKVLTDHLCEVNKKDKHLEVQYFPNGIPYDSEKPPVAEDVKRFRELGRRRNYQFKKVERLDGGIGLLQVDGFYPAEWITETAAAAMAFLANSEAVILDLRDNQGGASGGTLLCSYFFKEETHLTDFYNRAENSTRQIWSYPVAGTEKFADKDLYILTSGRTFSASEALAYDMQALKRATIVGETTHGGANPTTIYRLTDHFSASIPFARSINPVTKTDLEGGGVKPDVAVPADQALLTSHLLALKKSVENHRSDRDLVNDLKRTIAEKEKELAAMKAKPGKP
jgi:hypothetical protein